MTQEVELSFQISDPLPVLSYTVAGRERVDPSVSRSPPLPECSLALASSSGSYQDKLEDHMAQRTQALCVCVLCVCVCVFSVLLSQQENKA